MQTPLVPAQLARDEPGDLGEEQAAAGRDRGHGEREPELVSPDRAAHEPERPPDADDREHCQDEEDGDDRLSRPRPGRPGPGCVSCVTGLRRSSARRSSSCSGCPLRPVRARRTGASSSGRSARLSTRPRPSALAWTSRSPPRIVANRRQRRAVHAHDLAAPAARVVDGEPESGPLATPRSGGRPRGQGRRPRRVLARSGADRRSELLDGGCRCVRPDPLRIRGGDRDPGQRRLLHAGRPCRCRRCRTRPASRQPAVVVEGFQLGAEEARVDGRPVEEAGNRPESSRWDDGDLDPVAGVVRRRDGPSAWRDVRRGLRVRKEHALEVEDVARRVAVGARRGGSRRGRRRRGGGEGGETSLRIT